MVKTKTADKLFEIFCGDYIAVVTGFSIESVTQTDKTIEQVKAPLIAEGWLTDQDDNYFYLGSIPETYDQAIKKNEIIMVEVKEPPPVENERKRIIPIVDNGLN